MRLRTLLHALLCLATPVLILACSFVFTGDNWHHWLYLQRGYPLLWLVDFCAAYTFLILVMAIGSWEKSHQRDREMLALQQEHLAQLDAVVRESAELDGERNVLYDKLSELSEENKQKQAELEEEAKRLAEHAFRAIQGQIDAQGRQLDAVNLALQYHRAEISQMRHQLKINPPSDAVETQFARLSPEEYAAVAAPLSRTLSERVEAFAIQPVHDTEPIVSRPEYRTAASNIEL